MSLWRRYWRSHRRLARVLVGSWDKCRILVVAMVEKPRPVHQSNPRPSPRSWPLALDFSVYFCPMKRLAGVTFVLAAALILPAADLTGTWSANVVLDAGNGTATFKLMQMGDTLAGTYSCVLGDATVTGTVKGNQVEWSFQSDQVGKIVYTGTLDGASRIKGTCLYGALGKGTFTADKK
jgi:hypothetical protein